MEGLNTVYGGNTVQTYLTALAILILTTLLLYAVQRIAIRRLAVLAAKTANDLDDLLVDLLRRTRFYFLLVVSLYAATRLLAMDEGVRDAIRIACILLVLFQAGKWGSGVITHFIRKPTGQPMARDAAGATTLSALEFIANVLLWSILVLLALGNLGFDITTLVAGLGITGIAAALAVQSVLGDLFASLSIALDKPFVVGDFIVVDTLSGTVEHVGLKTTRVRSLSGEQIVFSNGDLLRSRIRNFQRLKERRASFTISIAYETPRTLVELVPTILRETVEAQEDVRFDRAHFQSFGESGLVFECVYFVTRPEYLSYVDLQQRINLGIFDRFQKEDIHFAYPTRTLYVKQSETTDDTN